VPYLTPPSIPSGRVCRPLFIPDEPEWLALFGGALTELSFRWNWEQITGISIEDTLQEVAVILEQWYGETCGDCALPDGDPVMRLGTDYKYEQLIDGVWSSPTGDYAIPAVPARTEPTSEERRCLAAANAEYVLHQLYEEITDSAGSGLAALEALTLAVVVISTLVAPYIALAYRALAAVAFGVWQLGFDLAENITADYWGTDFSENLRCALYRVSTDDAGVVTFDFDALNQELIDQINWIDPTFSSFAIAGQVRWMLTQFGIDALNHAGATENVLSADCSDCGAEWCYVFTDFSEWTIDLGAPNTQYEYLGIELPDDGTYELTSFTAKWNWNGIGGGGSSGLGMYSRHDLGGSLGSVAPFPATVPPEGWLWQAIDDFSIVTDYIAMAAVGDSPSTQLSPAEAVFTGYGICPFGTPNCE